MSDVAERLAAFLEPLEEARRALAHPVTLIVVTKFHPASLVQALADAGAADVGESRYPEVRLKRDTVDDPRLTWHFVGQLQRKKARHVAACADVLHSIDSIPLVDALESGFDASDRPRRDAFVQVNLTSDPTRGGVDEAGLEPLAERVAASRALRLRGIMAVAPLDEAPASAFSRLRRLSDVVRSVDATATDISAGMSNDWRAALDEGATHLRIGSAITGNRPTPA